MKKQNDMPSKLPRNVVWDLTLFCPFHCPICCMNAKHLDEQPERELSTEAKHKLLDEIIDHGGFSIDFSGGEPLIDKEAHFPLIKKASLALGKENVGLSCSGAYMDDNAAAFITEYCGDVELTLDCSPMHEYRYRPHEYSKTALHAAKLLKEHGATVGLQTVATRENTSPEIWQNTYDTICRAGVDEWSILRFQLCGRGENFPNLYMDARSCTDLVARTKLMDMANKTIGKPRISFSYLMPGHERYADSCRCVRQSVGIIGDKILSCFWAIGKDGDVSDPNFFLGHVPAQNFSDIVECSANAKYWLNHTDVCSLCDTADAIVA